MASVRKRFGVESLSDLKREFERKKAEDEKTAQEIFNASE